jgi:hypothetical protein
VISDIKFVDISMGYKTVISHRYESKYEYQHSVHKIINKMGEQM